MVKAILNETVLAESDNTQVVEGNHYFPPESVKKEYLTESDTSTVCPWKGTASYYDGNVDGNVVKDVGWYYGEPKEAAKEIKGFVAFYKTKVQMLR